MARRQNITDRSIWYITTGHVKKILHMDKITGLTPYRAMGRRNTFYSIEEVIALAQSKGLHVTHENIDQEMFSGGYPPIRNGKEVTIEEMFLNPEEQVEASVTTAQAQEPAYLPPLSLTAYVDGSFNKETKVYGSAVVILDPDGNVLLKKSFPGTQYNEMWQVAGELRAAMAAVVYAEEYMADNLLIRYDYEGIEKWATGAWRANKEGPQKYVAFMGRKRNLEVSFEHVKAHTGDKYNELVDDMAKAAAGVSEKDRPVYTGTATKLSSETLIESFNVSPQCIEDIKIFRIKAKKTFGDYLKVRVHGKDGLSELYSIDDFSDILNDSEISFLKENSVRNDLLLQACRWTARGLTPEEALRKVQVDAEIAAKKR